MKLMQLSLGAAAHPLNQGKMSSYCRLAKEKFSLSHWIHSDWRSGLSPSLPLGRGHPLFLDRKRLPLQDTPYSISLYQSVDGHTLSVAPMQDLHQLRGNSHCLRQARGGKETLGWGALAFTGPIFFSEPPTPISLL